MRWRRDAPAIDVAAMRRFGAASLAAIREGRLLSEVDWRSMAEAARGSAQKAGAGEGEAGFPDPTVAAEGARVVTMMRGRTEGQRVGVRRFVRSRPCELLAEEA
jgi:hypothetical protein